MQCTTHTLYMHTLECNQLITTQGGHWINRKPLGQVGTLGVKNCFCNFGLSTVQLNATITL